MKTLQAFHYAGWDSISQKLKCVCHTCIISCARLPCKGGVQYSVALYFTKCGRSFSALVQVWFVYTLWEESLNN